MATVQSQPEGISVIIPAFNEEGGVGNVIGDIRKALAETARGFEILVVDDGSTDCTAERAREAGAVVIAHEMNRGYGAAVKTGVRSASYETIVLIDADGTYPPSAIGGLLEELRACDMVVAARRGSDNNIPLARRPAKWLLNRVAQLLAERPIPDLNSGLRVFRRSDALRFRNLYPNGFSFTSTITLAFLCNDLAVRYLPIDYLPRVGKSKLRPIRDTKNLFLTVVRSILFFNPLRVCLPVALALAALALFVLAVPRDTQGHIYDGTVMVLATCAVQVLIVGFLADVIARMR